MATPDEIAEVRENTGLTENVEPWTDERLGDIIDSVGSVSLATASIWTRTEEGWGGKRKIRSIEARR